MISIGDSDPLDYPTILVNEGNLWQAPARSVAMGTGGYYFIHISAGVLPHTRLYLYLRGPQGLFRFLDRDVEHDAMMDMFGRSVIMHFPAGGTTYVELRVGGVYSDSMMQTSFTGFLLYED